MEMFIGVLALVILFGITIFVHELGHFLAAKSCGMVADVFSIGFGPAIWKKKFWGTVFKISWIPFGGYVALPQLDPSGMEAVQGGSWDGKKDGKEGDSREKKEEEPVRILPPVSPWLRIYVAVAGAFGNILFAVLLAWVVYWSPSAITDEGSTVLGFVRPDSVAYQRGVRAGDEIVSINGEKVETWYDLLLRCNLVSNTKREVGVVIKSGGTTRELSLPLMETNLVRSIAGIGKPNICMVVGVMEGSSAEKAGLKARDIVRAFDGRNIWNTEHLQSMVASRLGVDVPLLVERGGKAIELRVTPRYGFVMEPRASLGVKPSRDFYEFTVTRNPDNEKLAVRIVPRFVTKPMIGMSFDQVEVPSWMQFRKPWSQIKNDFFPIIRLLKALATPAEAKKAAEGLGGPPIIFMTLWFAIQLGFVNALAFIRFLNINLAIINMLPLPVLDGGHVVFALWEGLTRRKVHPKLVNFLVNIFIVLLLLAMVVLSYRDIFHRIPMYLGKKKDKAVSTTGRHVDPVEKQAPASPGRK
jgi:regulator of sigma E protease